MCIRDRDCIATDHAPHTAAEKAKGLTEAPSGMVGLETVVALTLTKLYHGGYLTLEEIAAKMSANPAKVLRQDWSGITPGEMCIRDRHSPPSEWLPRG